MANFCGKCGTAIDPATGLCPNCDSAQNSTTANKTIDPIAESFSFPKSDETVKTTKKSNRSKGLQIFLTIFLSVCLFFNALFAILIFETRNTLKEDTLENLFKNIRITELLYSTNTADSSDLEAFYNGLEEEFDISMTDNSLDDFVIESSIIDFVAEEISDYCEDFFEGEGRLVIKRTEIIDLIYSNRDEIYDKFGTYLDYSDCFEIASWMFESDSVEIVDTDYFKDQIPAAYYTINIFLSYITMGAFILLAALFFFLMIRNSLTQAFCGAGIVFIILGGLTSLVALLSGLITPAWDAMTGESLVGDLVGKVIAANALPNAIILILGIGFVVASILIINARKKKNA